MPSFHYRRALPYLCPVQSAEDTAPLHRYGSNDAPVARAFAPSIVVTYVIEEPGARVFVRQRDVHDHEHAKLHAYALENLRAHAASRRVRLERSGATHIAKLDGEHDASLLLLDELWDPPTCIASHEGELIVAIPARQTLVLTGTATDGGLTELRATISRYGRTLASDVFVRRDGAWASYAR